MYMLNALLTSDLGAKSVLFRQITEKAFVVSTF